MFHVTFFYKVSSKTLIRVKARAYRLNLVENYRAKKKYISLFERSSKSKMGQKLLFVKKKEMEGYLIEARGGNAMQNGLLGQTAITSNTMRLFPTKVIQGERLAPPK